LAYGYELLHVLGTVQKINVSNFKHCLSLHGVHRVEQCDTSSRYFGKDFLCRNIAQQVDELSSEFRFVT
jgi:hypothetical protein